MSSITVTLPDGSKKEAPQGISIHEFVKTSIGAGLAKAAVFARVNGKDVDLSRTLDDDASLQVFTDQVARGARGGAPRRRAHRGRRGAAALPRHPGDHRPDDRRGLLLRLLPRASPSPPRSWSRSRRRPTRSSPRPRPSSARRSRRRTRSTLFEKKGEKFKVEIVKDIVAKGAKTLTLYTPRRLGRLLPRAPRADHGEGRRHQDPHRPRARTGAAITATRMLQRIYGTSFFDKKALDAWVKQREEAAEARPPQAGQGARPLPLPPVRARLRLLDAQGHQRSTPRSPAGCASSRSTTATSRSRRRSSTTRACGRSAATGTSTRRTCSSCRTARPRSTTSRSSR